MAHSTDYASIRDINSRNISHLKRSSPKTLPESDANILVRNFLRSNPNWAIDSLVSYLLSTYSDFGITKTIISDEIKSYILEK